VINGKRRHAMCAVDALGMTSMLDQMITIEGECAVCRTPIQMGARSGTLGPVKPQDAVVVARLASDGPAAEACCPFTVFACGPAHAQELRDQISGATVLSLNEALSLGETLFGDLRGEVLQVPRRRPKTASMTSALSAGMEKPMSCIGTDRAESKRTRG
jgi:hypothetical protein